MHCKNISNYQISNSRIRVRLSVCTPLIIVETLAPLFSCRVLIYKLVKDLGNLNTLTSIHFVKFWIYVNIHTHLYAYSYQYIYTQTQLHMYIHSYIYQDIFIKYNLKVPSQPWKCYLLCQFRSNPSNHNNIYFFNFLLLLVYRCPSPARQMLLWRPYIL